MRVIARHSGAGWNPAIKHILRSRKKEVRLNLEKAVSPQRHREHRVKTQTPPALLAHTMVSRRHDYKLLMFRFSLCLCGSVVRFLE